MPPGDIRVDGGDMTKSVNSGTAGAEHAEWHEFVRTHWIVFLDGASGTGKSTFKTLLVADPEFDFCYARRYTTRQKRMDDDRTDDYVFVSAEEFRCREQAGDLVEYRHFLFGMSYGIGRESMIEAGRHSASVLAVMNLGNVRLVKAAIPTALCILIDSPIETIEYRLRARGLNNEKEIEERLTNARETKRLIGDYDFVFKNEQGDVLGSYTRLKEYLISRRPH